MTSETIAIAVPPATVDNLVMALQDVLRNSAEPLTLSMIRTKLPQALRDQNLEEALRRQVAANVLYQFPRYRSPQDRFWDRPMPVHIAELIKATLENGPLSWSDLRRKLPAYAQTQAEVVMEEMVARQDLHKHPRQNSRGGDRLGVRPADPKDYLRPELSAVFARLQPQGFTTDQLRAAALELLHDEEWASTPPQGEDWAADLNAATPACTAQPSSTTQGDNVCAPSLPS